MDKFRNILLNCFKWLVAHAWIASKKSILLIVSVSYRHGQLFTCFHVVWSKRYWHVSFNLFFSWTCLPSNRVFSNRELRKACMQGAKKTLNIANRLPLQLMLVRIVSRDMHASKVVRKPQWKNDFFCTLIYDAYNVEPVAFSCNDHKFFFCFNCDT